MRVGLVIYGGLDWQSGGYLYDRKLVEYLREEGDEVEVVSLPWRNYTRHLGDNLSARLLRRLAQLKVDVLLEDELNHPSLFWLNRKLKRKVGYPVVAIVHHLRGNERHPRGLMGLYQRVEKRYLDSVDGFVYNSLTTRAEVERAAEEGKPGAVATPGGDHLEACLTPDEVEARAWEAGPLRVIFVGNVIPRKGLHTLVEAVGRLGEGVCEVRVAGTMRIANRDSGGRGRSEEEAKIMRMANTYARKVMDEIKRLGLEGRVKLLGAVGEEELVKSLRECQVLAVPSSYEGFGIAYLEGMGFGLPAIGTTAGGAKEIITHGQDGFLIEPGNVAGLADIFQSLQNDRERLAALSLSALSRYQKQPTWRESAAKIRAFLSHLV